MINGKIPRKSIRTQMILVFVGLVVCAFVVLFVANAAFLERYYVYNKEKDLVTVYAAINKSIAEDDFNEEGIQDRASKILEKGNIALLILDAEGTGVYTTLQSSAQQSIIRQRLLANLFGKNEGAGKVLEKESNYQINQSKDFIANTEYVEMWGFLDNGDMFILQTPVESIRESVSMTGNFLAFAGGGVIVLCIILVWYFSRRITEPVLELAELSKKMADLDFGARYTGVGMDEIGVLGENFNIMSEKLQIAVSELKNANYELHKDIEQKEKMETMRTEFIGNVSHELKTPIALIQGYAEGLKEGISDDAESREFYCDVIMDEAAKMNLMVKNLLTLSQLEAGSREVQYDRFNIVELIQGVIESMQILIRQKNVRLNFVHESDVYVWADEFQAEQVIRNYVSNALNHVSGENLIEVRIHLEDDVARVTVFNTGSPIPEEDIGHIWDKFYKVDKARTREYGGNGIGLSIVKAIMESFQHEYGVKNYNNGVEFWFELEVK